MMPSLDLYSERYSANGNVAARGILNQLGRPSLDILSVLVRETVQNSWDARLNDSETIYFGVKGRTLSDDQVDLLRNIIFASVPASLGLHNAFSKDSEVYVLIIYDRGTTGLDGPTRADCPDDATRSRNFINFFRNFGQPPEKRLGGGTYGFGKSVLYLASKVHTICVHTHCLLEGKVESRFIAAALEDQTEGNIATRSPYTGRHWWGQFKEDVIEPICGHEADELAQRLGFPEFAQGECGTSCMILLPAFADIPLEEVMHLIVDILLWYFWPKMLKNEHGTAPITFDLSWEGNPILLPDPGDYPPLQGFVQAMDYLKSNTPDDRESFLHRVVSIDCQRPKMHLGLLSLQRFQYEERRDQFANKEEVIIPITGICHHVALMRKAELVVKYLPGPTLPSGQIEYAGVFMVDDQVDRSFAAAEPPTHDDWLPHFLTERHEKTYVRVALERIRQALTVFTTPQPTTGKEGHVFPLGAFADRLGSLLPGEEGPAGYVPPVGEINERSTSAEETHKGKGDSEDGKSDSGTSAPTRPNIVSFTETENGEAKQAPGHQPKLRHARVKLLDEGKLELLDSTPSLLTQFFVEHAPGSAATRVEVETSAVLDNGELERESPANSLQPEVLFWIDPAGMKRSGSDVLVISATDTGIWKVAVSIPDDMIIGITLTAREV
jgi:hypothetical protein